MKTVIGTHDGSFHADEVMAIAIIAKLENQYTCEIIRSRNPDELAKADVLVDVGMVYDEEKELFDHHQKGGVIIDGRAYASAGLVWKHYGPDLLDDLLSDSRLADRVWALVDKRLISGIDRIDLGDKAEGFTTVSHLIASMNPHPMEKGADATERFYEALEFAELVLGREIQRAMYDARGEEEIDDAVCAAKSGVVTLKRFLPWVEFITQAKCPDVKRVMWHDPEKDMWMVQQTRWAEPMPEAWCGLSTSDLVKVTGMKSAVFCHPTGFICGFRDKKDADMASLT